MKKTTLVPESSELYRKIDALNLMPAARNKAITTLRRAEMLVGFAFELVAKLRQRASAASSHNVATAGKLKHQ